MRKICNMLFAVILFVAAAWFSHMDKAWQIPAFFIAAAIIAMLFAHLDKIVSLTVSREGIALMTRAEDILRETQCLAQYTASFALEHVEPSFWGPSAEQVDKVLCGTKKLLEELELPMTEDLREALDKTHARIELKYRHAILQAIDSAIFQDTALEYSKNPLLDANALRELIQREAGEAYLTPFIEERLQDYAYYVVHKQHKDKAMWFAQNEWGKRQKTQAAEPFS